MADNIKTIAVIGAGTMGNGIAHVVAQSGRNVTLIDLAEDLLDQAVATISRNLGRQVAKGKIDQSLADASLGHITTTTALDGAAGADIVIEAASENVDIKLEIFRKLDDLCPPESILASNTSSISITKIAGATGRPEKIIGMHFMNPVPMMRLVEVVRGEATDDATHDTIVALASELGKSPLTVNDAPGFVSNRILLPMINEAVFCLMEGVAEPEAIDQIMEIGMAHPMGPLRLADLIGLDTCLFIMEVLHRDFADEKYRPCPLLKDMVANGKLGRKSGRGFFEYD